MATFVPRTAIRTLRTAAVLLALGLFAAPGHAESLRCGTLLVVPGDTKPQVLRHCGQPLWSEVVSGADEPVVEQWIYRLPGAQLDQILTFRGLRLVRIQTRSR